MSLGVLGTLASFIPGIARLLQSPTTSSEVLEQIATCAQHLSGQTDPGKMAEVFQKHPHLIASLYRELARIEETTTYDRRDARQRDVMIFKDSARNVRADVMVIAAAMGLLGCLVALAYYQNHLPGEAVGIISTIAGIFGSCLKDAYGFEFGSSRGSKTKDEHVAAVLRGRS